MYVFRLACVAVLALASACTAERSSTPLSPSVAGVTIGPPRPVLPASGTRLNRETHPIMLVVENASTTGGLPLSYVFEGSTDAAFAAEVFRQAGVSTGPDGRTGVQVPGPLPAGRTYYWRVRATDGTTLGPYSDVAHFTVYEAFVLAAPTPMSPTAGETVPTRQPTLRTTNAGRSGPAEPVSYDFEVSLSNQFGALVTNATLAETEGQTEWTVSPLAAATTHHWRVRARSASTTGPWSATETFITPGATAPVPPPPGGGLPPSNPGPRPNVREGLAMVEAVIADMRARGIRMDGDCGGFEITRRVAWAFRNRGAGLERKPGGRNCQGHSIDIVIFTDGQTVDILVGAGVDNGPSWQEHGVLSDWRDWWIAPTDPG